jgi:excinuclease ABC subunit C
VRSYFAESADDGRPLFTAIVRNTVDIDYMVTDTEQEALVLEAAQIKTHAPRFNIKLKDDKKYPFICISREPYPRIFVTRDLVDDGSRYLGPYSNVRAMRNSLDLMHKLFPVRACDYILPKNGVRLCLEYQIKRCEGPCEHLVTQETYAQTIDLASRFLKGHNADIIRDLSQQMDHAAEALDYERAARLRDTIRALRATTERRARLVEGNVDRDVIGIARDDHEACCFVLEIREGMAGHQKHHLLANTIDAADKEIVSHFVRQFYHNTDFVPAEIHLPCAIEEEDGIAHWLSQRGQRVRLLTPQRGDKADAMRMATSNAEQILKQRRLKRELRRESVPRDVEALQRDLGLDNPPHRIEAIDISTLQGDSQVGSLVCMIEGKIRKSEYRTFNIKTVEGVDDYASIREVVLRRYKAQIEGDKPLPDLLLIDGGKGQLASACTALAELEVNVPTFGIAKRLDEIFAPDASAPIILPKTSASLRTLQIIRDEAHRFAITRHRQRRQKDMVRSALDTIPGVGPKRRVALLQAFGSINRIKQATAAEIGQIGNIGPALATTILDHLGKNSE